MPRHTDNQIKVNKFIPMAKRQGWAYVDLTQQEVFAVDSSKREPWTLRDKAHSLAKMGNSPRAVAMCLGITWEALVALMGTEFCAEPKHPGPPPGEVDEEEKTGRIGDR